MTSPLKTAVDISPEAVEQMLPKLSLDYNYDVSNPQCKADSVASVRCGRGDCACQNEAMRDAGHMLRELRLQLTASASRITELETENRHLRAEVYE